MVAAVSPTWSPAVRLRSVKRMVDHVGHPRLNCRRRKRDDAGARGEHTNLLTSKREIDKKNKLVHWHLMKMPIIRLTKNTCVREMAVRLCNNHVPARCLRFVCVYMCVRVVCVCGVCMLCAQRAHDQICKCNDRRRRFGPTR